MPVRRDRNQGGLFKKANSKYWYAQYYQNGRQIRVSTKHEVKAKAEGFLRNLLAGRDNGHAPADDVRRLRYSDLRTILISHYEAQGHKSLRTLSDGTETVPGLDALDKFCGYKTDTVDGKVVVTDEGVPVTTITTDFARRFANQRIKEDKAGNAIVNRSLAALRRMLRLAKNEGRLTNVPYIELRKEPAARKGFLERADFYRLIDALPTHLRPLVTFLYKCGCRIGETLSITWSQVDLDARVIRIEPEQTKTDEGRVIPLGSQLTEMLAGIQGKDDEKVFDATNLRKEWMKAC